MAQLVVERFAAFSIFSAVWEQPTSNVATISNAADPFNLCMNFSNVLFVFGTLKRYETGGDRDVRFCT
jgi:hypothetical protein